MSIFLYLNKYRGNWHVLNTRMFEGPRAVKLSNPNFDIQTINSIVLLEMLDTSSRFPTVHISKSNPCFASKKILRRDTWPQKIRTRRTIVSNLKHPSTAHKVGRLHFLPFLGFYHRKDSRDQLNLRCPKSHAPCDAIDIEVAITQVTLNSDTKKVGKNSKKSEKMAF